MDAYRWHGKHGKGAMRLRKALKREQAEERAQALREAPREVRRAAHERGQRHRLGRCGCPR